MGSDPPDQQLVLSDIIHTMSPSPSLHGEHTSQQRSDSPELLSEEDIVRMRDRIADMGFSSDAKLQVDAKSSGITSKEEELGGMVVKLLDSYIDPSQLLRQAEFINWLGAQRDILVQSFEEERRRWEAEREGWTRMAEALLAQRAKAGNLPSLRDEELERQRAVYESENKVLREKLQDSQSRFSALETELNKLKPLLLMQPQSSIASISSAEHPSEPKSSRAKRRAVDSPFTGEHELSGSVLTPRHNTSTNQQTQPDDSIHNLPRSEYYRQNRLSFLTPLQSRLSAHSTPIRSVLSATQTPSTHPGSSKKSKSKSKKISHNNLLPLTADARTEHLLLAARKIGRERANMVSGLMRRVEKEKEEFMREREAERLEREKVTTGVGGNTYYRKGVVDLGMSPSPAVPSTAPPMPKTPKRGTVGAQTMTHFLTPTLMTPRSDFYPPATHTPNSFVFVGSPAVTSYQNSVSTPRPAGQPPTTSTTKPTQIATMPATHPTPLASLLSAAKSMMDDESNEPGTNLNGRRRAGSLEPPDSPLPKRRKVGNGGQNNSTGKVDMLAATATPGTDRVRSALDVLADQAAAAFDSDWQSPTKPPTKLASKSRGKDKGSQIRRASVSSEEEIDEDPTPKGRTPWREESLSRVSTGSPVSTRSRSKVLLTERLSKQSSKMPHKKKSKSFHSHPRSAPAPRMIFSPEVWSSIPPSPVPPTPSGAVSGDNNDVPPVRTEGRRVGTSVDDEDPTHVNGISESPTPSNAEDDYPHISGGSPLDVVDENTHVPQSHAVTPNELVQEDETFVTKAHENEINSAADDDHAPHRESVVVCVPDGEKKMEDAVEGRRITSHLVHSPLDDNPDTDADAEGEMDVDAEETVFMGSSLTHEPRSLAASSPQPGRTDVAPRGKMTNDERGPSISQAIMPMDS